MQLLLDEGVDLSGEHLLGILGVDVVEHEGVLLFADDGDALGAVAQAEAGLKVDEVLDIVLFQYFFEGFYDAV